ncbi:Coiled-coil domain-containing protein 16 [Aphelenchoides bicaudatus]|nr:Coiled-coil domain-containing protein 16 [Aphelenchoides bicaudatus]
MSDYICNVCHQKVKIKLKRAHESGAKHRENLRKQTAPKRPATTVITEVEEEPTFKKPRPTEEPIISHSVAARLPKQDEEDGEPASALPNNFFDSTAKKKAEVSDANLDKEFSKFMNEVDRMEKKEEEIDDKEDALRNDLEMIDEQIEMWRNLNELEKQKDQLLAAAHSKAGVLANSTEQEDKIMEDEAESDDDFDAFGLDWRSRKI